MQCIANEIPIYSEGMKKKINNWGVKFPISEFNERTTVYRFHI